MMAHLSLKDIIKQLNLTVLTGNKDFSNVYPSGGYASDLLSCVMAGARHGSVWVTLQSHVNIVAVAALLEITAVIITEGAEPDEATLNKATEQDITLLSTTLPSYVVVGKLWEMGLQEH